MSWNFYDTHQYPLADENARYVLSEAGRLNFDVEASAAENLLGGLLTQEKKYDQALVHYNNGLKIRRKLNDPQGRANILANMGDTYVEMSDYKRAVESIEQGIAIADSIGGSTSAAWDYLRWNYLRLSNVYSAMSDFDRALEYVNLAEETGRLSLHGATRNAKDFQVELFEQRRKVLIGQNKIREALQLSLILEQLKDSLGNTGISDRIVGLQASYELEEQSQEIKLRNDEIAIQKGEIQKQQIVIVSILIASVLLSVLLYLSYNYYKKTRSLNRVLQDRNVEIQEQSAALTTTNDALQSSNLALAEKNEEIQTQSEKLTEANSTLINLNNDLAEKQLNSRINHGTNGEPPDNC
jgi:tetratricopeptide (TPR) repeat protein